MHTAKGSQDLQQKHLQAHLSGLGKILRRALLTMIIKAKNTSHFQSASMASMRQLGKSNLWCWCPCCRFWWCYSTQISSTLASIEIYPLPNKHQRSTILHYVKCKQCVNTFGSQSTKYCPHGGETQKQMLTDRIIIFRKFMLQESMVNQEF